jgi:hypothetical protein
MISPFLSCVVDRKNKPAVPCWQRESAPTTVENIDWPTRLTEEEIIFGAPERPGGASR